MSSQWLSPKHSLWCSPWRVTLPSMMLDTVVWSWYLVPPSTGNNWSVEFMIGWREMTPILWKDQDMSFNRPKSWYDRQAIFWQPSIAVCRHELLTEPLDRVKPHWFKVCWYMRLMSSTQSLQTLLVVPHTSAVGCTIIRLHSCVY